MKKALIALVLVAAMSMSAFAVSLELLNVVQTGALVTGNTLCSGVGVGMMIGPVDATLALSSIDNGGTTGTIITLKGYMEVMAPLRVGLQIDNMSVNVGNRTQMALLVGVKKPLVAGVNLVLDGIVYFADGTAAPNAETNLLNGGATIGLSIPII